MKTMIFTEFNFAELDHFIVDFVELLLEIGDFQKSQWE